MEATAGEVKGMALGRAFSNQSTNTSGLWAGCLTEVHVRTPIGDYTGGDKRCSI